MSGQPRIDMNEYKRSHITIHFGDNPGIRFFIKHAPGFTPRPCFETTALFFKGKTSDLYYDSQNQVLYKFFLAKKKKNLFFYFVIKRLWEIVKNILGFCPAKKEFSGNRLLHQYEFNVPETLGIGFVISPAAQYRCLLILQNIQSAATLKEILAAGADPARLEIIRHRIINDIQRMIANKIRFRDFTVNNILVDTLNNIYWIDSRADKFYFQILYRKAKNSMLKRFIGSFRQASSAPQASINSFVTAVRDLIQ
ncbi:MAG: lipopolysaccharide kinase InaA family protein [Desulfobacterales bacterium]|jgi:hypothetical protein|nr:lipopolysaccharide kinase InaA family protein [Desulfobacterales bacterium]